MVFRPPSALMQKVARLKSLSYQKDGSLQLWGIPSTIIPAHTFFYMYRLLEKLSGSIKAKEAIYFSAKFQAKTGFDIITKRFGYGETIHDKKKLLEFNMGQSAMMGMGNYKWTRLDFTNYQFIVEGISPFAKSHRELQGGLVKECVDYFMAGAAAGAIESICNVPMSAVETKCYARGDPYCQFIVKPIKEWKKTNPLAKENPHILKKTPDLKALGSSSKQVLSFH